MQGVAGGGPVDPFDLAIGPDDLDRRGGGRRLAFGHPTLTGGRARAGDRDVRQWGEVGQRNPDDSRNWHSSP